MGKSIHIKYNTYKSLQDIDNGRITIDNTPKKRYLKGVDNLFTIDQSYTYNSITLKYAYYKSSGT